jgi:heme-degrading monooxygenase HmoA
MDDYTNFQNDPNKPKSDLNNPHFDKLERDVYEVYNSLSTMPKNTGSPSNKAIALVALHWMGTEKFDRGMEAFKKNTTDSRNANGLISRMALKSTTDPELWATVTVWESMDHYNNFQNLPDRPKSNKATPLFDKVERDVYAVDENLSLNWAG